MVLMNIRHFKIQVVGAVISPGFATISSVERLTDAIKKSGGLNKYANEDNIIIENGGSAFTDNDGNILLFWEDKGISGDVTLNCFFNDDIGISVIAYC